MVVDINDYNHYIKRESNVSVDILHHHRQHHQHLYENNNYYYQHQPSLLQFYQHQQHLPDQLHHTDPYHHHSQSQSQHQFIPKTYNNTWYVNEGVNWHLHTNNNNNSSCKQQENETPMAKATSAMETYRAIVVNVNGDTSIAQPSNISNHCITTATATALATAMATATATTTTTSATLTCAIPATVASTRITATNTHSSNIWLPWCRPAVVLLVLVLLVLIFVLISGILLYFNYTSYKPKKIITEEPCVKTFCAWGATCVNQEGRAQCLCPTECPSLSVRSSVCATDGRTYASHCHLRLASCQRRQNTRVRHIGECELSDPCAGKECAFGARCVPSSDGRNATCQCPVRCPSYGDHAKSRPVCGTDGRDYRDQCELTQTACTTSTNITVKFFGKCYPCTDVECAEPEICQLDENREPVCRCGDTCPLEFTPVCGSDGKTYSNECSLRQEACRTRKPLRIIYRGKCSSGKNPCLGVHCILDEECIINKYGIARCECAQNCEPVMRPICTEDGRTFSSECEMRYAACVSRTPVAFAYSGVCGKQSACSEHTCHYGAVCVERAALPHCECPVCSAEFNPVCGSDGISYGNKCKLRLEACKHRRDITILYDGPCSGCENKKCEFYSTCESDGATEGHCVCPTKCDDIQDLVNSSICGSNGNTYGSECEMRIASCKMKRHIQIAYKGSCNLCQAVQCKFGARCEAGECVCPTNCEGSGSEPVCASTMITYPNECELQKTACQLSPEASPLSVIFYGDCRERFAVTASVTTLLPDTLRPETVSSLEMNSVTDLVTVPEREACRDIHCDFEATCELGPDNFPRCTCQFDCTSPTVKAMSKPVCASDMRMYASLCEMKMEACQRQDDLRLRPLDLCQGMEVKPCNGEQPLNDAITKTELDCGHGPLRQDCPPGSYCHQTTRFAKCCQKVTNVTTVLQKKCEDSWYGCCPDGKTIAQGPNNAGCPSLCGCNRLGSYSDTCDPQTLNCQCKPGVGGSKCDRCEPGFWGLPKISSGHSGCIPCGCSAFGSVREDCEQMTGRCVCKPGIQGQKCTVCTDLNKILGPNGCVSADSNVVTPLTCNELNCYFGAICIERGGFAVCECHEECRNEVELQTVCGSDGQSYTSECHLKLMACRTQKDVVIQAFGKCKESAYSGTDWPVHRYTPMYFTQQDDTNSPLSKSTRHLLSPNPHFYYERGSSLIRAHHHQHHLLEGFHEHNTPAKINRIPTAIFQTKGENYAAAYRPTPATVHVVSALLGDICSVDSDCTILFSMCENGACTCKPNYISSTDRQQCIIVIINQNNTAITTPNWLSNREHRAACLSSPCALGSTCMDLPTSTFTCICGINRTGPLCETSIIEKRYEIPSFYGQSYVRLHSMRAYHKLSVEIEFKSYANDGILLYNQQKNDGTGDFVSVSIIKGFVEFRYNLGNGIVSIRSLDKIQTNKYHKIVVKRYHKDGMLKLDDGEDIVGQSQGNLKALDLNEDAYVGNVPTNISRVFENIGTDKGFIGCVRKFKIGRRLIELDEFRDDSVRDTIDVHECNTNPCLSKPCQNGAVCYIVEKELFTCKCTPPYFGTLCEQVNTNTSNNLFIPEFFGTSYMQFPLLKNIGKTLSIELWFLTKSANGLLFYNGQMKNGRGDFISLLLVHGHIQFRFNLGSGIANITSIDAIKIGKWSRVKVHRNGRYGSLQYDDSPPVTGTSGPPLTELNLELPFYAGSVPSWSEAHRLTGASKGFRGAIQRITIDSESLPLLSTLQKCPLKVTNTDTCMSDVKHYDGPPCPTLNNPCLNSGLCIPHLNTYKCQCTNHYQGNHCEKSMHEKSGPIKFTGKTFLQYRNRGNRSNYNNNTNNDNQQSDGNNTVVEDTESIDTYYINYTNIDTYNNNDDDNLNTFDSSRRHSERAIQYNIKFRTLSLNGLLLWRCKSKNMKSEYMSIAIVDGYPELSYNLGKQKTFWAIQSPIRVNDGKWHLLHVRRRKRVGFISIDNSLPVRGLSHPGSYLFNSNNRLWIGGSPNIPSGFPSAYYKGFQGCIKHVFLNMKQLNLSRPIRTTDSTSNSILQYCHDNDI